jgi:membrane protease YdiL (CAAX protease family)
MAETGEILLLLIAVRVWNYTGPPRAQPFVNPVAAIVVLAESPSVAGFGPFTIKVLVYALSGVAVIGAVYAVASRVPRLFGPVDRPFRTALVDIPLATVLFEEVAFRGVLPAVLGPYGSAILFGLWHIPPRRVPVAALLGTVVFTGAAGLVLNAAVDATGSLLVPFCWHWAANGLGVLTAAAVQKRKRRRPQPPALP